VPQPDPIDLNIGNICEGAVPQLFDREVLEVLKNIADVSTDPEQKRKITITFEFKPAPDRKSAVVSVTCTSKQAAVESKAGSIFFRKSLTGQIEAFAEDPRQDLLFAKQPTPTPSKN
jgi:hypothetical protein